LASALEQAGKVRGGRGDVSTGCRGGEKVLGKEHAQTLNSVNWLGNALYDQGKYEAAEDMYRRAIDGREKVLGREHAQHIN
jgi:tetratricopeptide (TPR) repeat protein